jgi:hypothetical protein
VCLKTGEDLLMATEMHLKQKQPEFISCHWLW